MANSKAQVAKDNGNLAFKSGDYSTAIGHYTTAILADQSEVTYPLNRAAAYLKLGKNEDAVRDCTRVLELSPKNVKALFRRSQARMGMGDLTEAHKDLLKVLQIEPSNQSAQEELNKVVSLIEKEKSKVSLNSSLANKRRRVPIKIIEPPSAAASTTSFAAPVQGPSKPQESHVSESSPPASPVLLESKLNSFKDAKQARENTKSSRVGGGIFRASGSNTIFTPRANGETSYTPIPKAPSTLFDFVKSWGSLRSTEEKWQLIISIPPTHLPALCKTSLETSMLVSIMETFLAMLDATKDDSRVKTLVLEYMENLAKIPRFNTLVLFLSKNEKVLAKNVWMAMGVDQPTGMWSGVV